MILFKYFYVLKSIHILFQRETMPSIISKLFLKKEQVSLKATVLSLFFFITIILVLLLISQLLYFSKKLSYESINLKLTTLVKDIQTSMTTNNKTNANVLSLLSFQNSANLKFYTKILENNRSLYAVYTGYSNGSFYEVINLNIHPLLRKIYNATSKDQWLLIEILGSKPNEKKVTLLDKDLKPTSFSITENTYNPTLRPWYKNALHKKTLIKTKPYEFSNIPSKGVTYAQQLENSEDVVGIDVLIYDIQDILKKHITVAYMDAYLFTQDRLIISSLMNDNTLLELFFKKHSSFKEFETPQLITLNNKEYIVQILPFKNTNSSDYVALFSKYDNVVAPYKQQTYVLIAIFIASLLVLIPLIIYFSNIIVKPIYKLVEQSQNIKNRKFDSVNNIESPVLEVALLSASIKEMSNAIYSYQHSLEKKVQKRTQELSLKNQELLKLSITDKLTGLYNRVKLDKTLQDEMNRSLRTGDVFCVILMDIDFFKKINDGYGHQTGDDVLVETAQVLQKLLRKTDVLGRWGGEEFLIISPLTSLENGIKLANKINLSVQSHPYSTYKNQVTMSIGVAAFQKNITKPEEIVANADKALYEAKHNGRNQVKIFQ